MAGDAIVKFRRFSHDGGDGGMLFTCDKRCWTVHVELFFSLLEAPSFAHLHGYSGSMRGTTGPGPGRLGA